MRVSLPPPITKWWSAFARFGVSRRPEGSLGSWSQVHADCRSPRCGDLFGSVFGYAGVAEGRLLSCTYSRPKQQPALGGATPVEVRPGRSAGALVHVGWSEPTTLPSMGSKVGFLGYCHSKENKETVSAEAMKEPVIGFLVNSQWIMNLVQAAKLSVANAQYILVKCVKASGASRIWTLTTRRWRSS